MKTITKIIHKNLNKRNYYTVSSIKRSTVILKKNNNLVISKLNYGLDGNKTTRELESKISILEKSKFSTLYTSGLMAIMIIYITFVKKKDIVLLPRNIYGPNLRGGEWLSKIIGFKINKYSNFSKFKEFKKIRKKIKLIWIELPGSITFESPKLKKIIEFSKKNKILSVIDNTYSSSFYFKPLEEKIDISIIALTKFYSSKSDILMGAICTNSKKINNRILNSRKNLGIGVSSDDCVSIIRNLTNIKQNIKKHNYNCNKVINFIKKKKIAKKIFLPNNKIFKKKINTNGLFSIILKEKEKKKIFNFIKFLKLFKFGYSWGGDLSIIMYYKNLFKNKIVLRFFVGLENYKDLIYDLKRSLIYSKIL
ncbi:PLP-dependent transferase [Candidatus Vidania fulgoroideorum]